MENIIASEIYNKNAMSFSDMMRANGLHQWINVSKLTLIYFL